MNNVAIQIKNRASDDSKRVRRTNLELSLEMSVMDSIERQIKKAREGDSDCQQFLIRNFMRRDVMR